MDYMGSMRQGFPPSFNAQSMDSQAQSPQGYYYHPYTPDQMYILAQLQQQRAMMTQGHLQPTKPNDPKPRLNKEEVEVLEREFQKNSKPSSSLKRELAERMGVDLARINNWFQNRRAKEKQIRKAREFEAQQAASNTTEAVDEAGVSEYFPHSNHQQPLQPSTGAFPVPCQPHSSDSHDSSSSDFASVDHTTDDDSNSFDYQEYPSPDSLSVPGAQLTPMVARYLAPQSHCDEDDQVGNTHMSVEHETMVNSTPLYSSDAADHESYLHVNFKGQLASPVSADESSPTTAVDLRFKSPPPPANIASRRNKGVPAQLHPTALRSSYGPKTGIDRSKRPDIPSPMRRIASATGLIPGRIQKSMMGASPRSPMYLERTKDALVRSMHGGQSPVLQSLNTALSPVMPSDASYLSCRDSREATVSSSASDEEQGYTFGSAQPSYFGMDSTLKSPPVTPGIRPYLDHSLPINDVEAAWNYVPQDEPLVTPGLGSFGSEEFSLTPAAPGYVSSSQPPTPCFAPSIGPTYYPWGIAGSGSGNAEYTFPDSYVPDASGDASPGLAHSKLFQFTQNITPQDFGTER